MKSNVRPQDLKFSKEELEKCFGRKMNREHFWRVFKQQYGYVRNSRKEEIENGNEGGTEGYSIRFA